VLFVPGVRDHMPDHWQTLLEQKLSKATCVPRMERDKLSCAVWVEMLDRSLAQIEGPSCWSRTAPAS
jgi:predicted alpha/beta hydrolase family esterase